MDRGGVMKERGSGSPGRGPCKGHVQTKRQAADGSEWLDGPHEGAVRACVCFAPPRLACVRVCTLH